MSFLEGKLNSIAEAAASGFLKVPVNLEQTSKQTGAGMSIADAAKTGQLKVPTAGEKKGQRPASYQVISSCHRDISVCRTNLNTVGLYSTEQFSLEC